MSEGRLDPAVLEALEQSLRSGREALHASFVDEPPTSGHRLVRAATDLVDQVVSEILSTSLTAVEEAHGSDARRASSATAVVALGGYGRRELCPRSDIDLLFLTDREPTEAVIAHVNAVLYALWDLGFEVGQAVRSVEDCLKVATEDQAVMTSLLDARLLTQERRAVPCLVPPPTTEVCPETPDSPDPNVLTSRPPGAARGLRPLATENRERFSELVEAIEQNLFSGGRSQRLIAQKLEEADLRRKRFGDSIFLLEPNVKESPGGLREIHTAGWVARARWRARHLSDLLPLGVLSPREGKALERSYGFLLRVRAELHLMANRRQDRLSFEYQERIARRLHYVRADERAGVERFMRAYYFHARQLELQAALIVERAISHRQRRPTIAQRTPGGFKIWAGTLTVSDREQFEQDPAALMRIFRVAQEEALEIYSYTKDRIAADKELLDRTVRRRPEVVRDFLTILEEPKTDGAILDVMHDLGILRRMIPEMNRITARWQHSLYHVYTVDAHSLMVFKNLKQLRIGGFTDQNELTRLMTGLPRPSLLYLAALLHDIGKGWPKGNHPERGARVAQVVGARLEEAQISSWTREETEDLTWLVRSHLMLSDMAQRRDVDDPDILQSVMEEVRSVERLTMLYLLTFADMKGTSPSVWTDWKAMLLRRLYENTLRLLAETGAKDLALHMESRRVRALQDVLQEVDRRPQSTISPGLLHAFTEAMPPKYLVSFPPSRMLRHAEMWQDVSRHGGLALRIRQLRREDTTRLTIVCPDRPGLLALLAGTLAINRLQILSAQIYSIDLDQSLALDILYLKDETGEICDDRERWRRVQEDLREVLFGDKDLEALLDVRLGRRRRRANRPAVKTEIEISNSESRTETVVDVFCPDQLGVLHMICQAMADQGLTISLAKISTQGARVADGFYVCDAGSGAKIEDPTRLVRIERAIRDAVSSD